MKKLNVKEMLKVRGGADAKKALDAYIVSTPTPTLTPPNQNGFFLNDL